MKIKALFFASSRDIVGSRMLEVDLPADSTLADLKRRLMEDFPGLRQISSSLSAAINADYVNDDSRRLEQNDEVALIPPVSGGGVDATRPVAGKLRNSETSRICFSK